NACSFRNTINTHSFTSLCLSRPCSSFSFSLCIVFFFNDTLTTEIYTLSLHDALPVSDRSGRSLYAGAGRAGGGPEGRLSGRGFLDRKSTRLNSSHVKSSYAVFCLKKKRKTLSCLSTCTIKSETSARDIRT